MSDTEKIMAELLEVRKLLEKNLNRKLEDEITELSLTKTARLLHIGVDTLKQKVEQGEIPALLDVQKNEKVYRFLLSDIKRYQSKRKYIGRNVRSLSGKELFEQIKNTNTNKLKKVLS